MRQRVSARERLQITLRYTSPQVTNHAVTTTTYYTTAAAAAAAVATTSTSTSTSNPQ